MRLKTGLTVIAGLAILQTAQAGLVFSESFEADYALGRLEGTGGGTGWEGDWFSTHANGGLRMSNDGVSLPSAGSIFAFGSRVDHSMASAAQSVRFLDPAINMGNTYYMSFSVRRNATGQIRIETNNALNQIRFGAGVNANGSVYSQSSTATDTSAAGVVAPGTVYTVIVKTTSTRTWLALYEVGVDTVPEDESGVVWLTDASGATGVSQDRLILTVSSGAVELDELRFGTTYQSVTADAERPRRLDLILLSK